MRVLTRCQVVSVSRLVRNKSVSFISHPVCCFVIAPRLDWDNCILYNSREATKTHLKGNEVFWCWVGWTLYTAWTDTPGSTFWKFLAMPSGGSLYEGHGRRRHLLSECLFLISLWQVHFFNAFRAYIFRVLSCSEEQLRYPSLRNEQPLILGLSIGRQSLIEQVNHSL